MLSSAYGGRSGAAGRRAKSLLRKVNLFLRTIAPMPAPLHEAGAGWHSSEIMSRQEGCASIMRVNRQHTNAMIAGFLSRGGRIHKIPEVLPTTAGEVVQYLKSHSVKAEFALEKLATINSSAMETQ
jgi:hypothetical protein